MSIFVFTSSSISTIISIILIFILPINLFAEGFEDDETYFKSAYSQTGLVMEGQGGVAILQAAFFPGGTPL